MPLRGCHSGRTWTKTPDADVFPDHDSRKMHRADAGQRRLAQHRRVVGDVRDQHRLAIFLIELPLDNRGAPGRDRDWVARSDCWAMREVVRMSCPVALLNFQFGALIARFMVVNPAVQAHLESTNRRVDVIALRS